MNQKLHIQPLPALADNYIWIIRANGNKHIVVVDPGEAGPVIEHCQRTGEIPVCLLITHRHWDHVTGIAALLEKFPGIPVYGPANEEIPHRTQAVKEGDVVDIAALSIQFTVMDIPGHTAGHVAYYRDGTLFCGDTVFGAGCGRIFDGTVEDFAASLRRIAQLPPETQLYCSHEYTVDNLGFARWVEPDNPAIKKRDSSALEKSESGEPTLPSSLALELQTNPFLRTDQPGVIAATQAWAGRSLSNPTQVFATLRYWKDSEYD